VDHVFVADLYSPGRTAQNPLLAEEFQRALAWHGLNGVTISGAHGRGAVPYAALRRWVQDQGATGELAPPER